MNNSISYSKKDRIQWEEWKDDSKILEQEYKKLSLNTLFFDPLLKKKFLMETEKKYKLLRTKFPNKKVVDRWDELEIKKMFGKGLNYNSLYTIYESVVWLLESNNKPKIVSEFGTGAGWSTVILRRELSKKCQNSVIFSIDISPHAIAASMALLDSYGISWILLGDDKDYEFIMKNIEDYYGYVVLQYKSFSDGINEYHDDSVDLFYSSHGTAYLGKARYVEVLKKIVDKGKKDTVFVTDSLNPIYSVELSKLGSIVRMLYPQLMFKYKDKPDKWYIYSGTKECNSVYYDSSQLVKIISSLNDPRSFILYKWINKLLSSFAFKRVLGIIKSLNLTAKIIEQYREDVYPSSLISNLLKEHSELGNFKVIDEESKPDWPPFMDTVKLIIKK